MSEFARLAAGEHHDPHALLGWHELDGGAVIRALRPLAERVLARFADGSTVELSHLEHGVWAAEAAGLGRDYELEAHYPDESSWRVVDPYRFAPSLGELDLHLIGEGRHERLWQALGAVERELEGCAGVGFAVWAPNARAVRLIGEFNHWDGRLHPMRSLGGSGVWELFLPGLGPGERYKFEILGPDGQWRAKADPMARYTEAPPATASMTGRSDYAWGDADWLERRGPLHEQPMSVYELHLGSWRPGLGYREVADELVDYVGALGYTHVEFLPLAEHPYGPSWGYQVTGYFAPSARFGHPDELRYLIDRLHRAGIGVLLDWVPGHFPKDEFALARFDGTALYEHADPQRGEQLDWGTLVFDYGRPEVRNFLVANALYWLEEFHVDGLRVDAVASMLYLDYSRAEGEWTPNQYGGREHLEAVAFLQEVTATCYRLHPGVVLIAEESTSWPGVTAPTSAGGLGFGLKWNMGWMHDSLQYVQREPVHRGYHHNEITFSLAYAWSENFLLPISHDEVVHGKGSLLAKMPGDSWQQLANLRAYLAFMWAHPGKKLLFMGQEFGQRSEWSEARPLDWWLLEQPAHRAVFELVGRLNRLYRELPPLWQRDEDPAGFEWLDGGAAVDNVLAFVRLDANRSPVVVLVNFAAVPHHDYTVPMPHAGRWRELLNTDALEYGGSGVGNLGVVTATETPWAGRAASATLNLPPLGALWLVPEA